MPDRYCRFFERSLFPILDHLNHTRITEILAMLLDSEHLDPREIHQRQRKQLSQTISNARRRSSFYRRAWSDDQTEGLPSDFPELDGLPVVSKSDFRDAIHEFPLRDFSGRIIRSPTSGSTGSPMVFLRCPEQESWFWALRFRIWRWAGYHPGDRYLTINLNPRIGWKKKLQDLLFRCSYMTFNADNQDSRLILETLKRKRIGFLNGFSSSLYVLSRYLLASDIDSPEVTGITATGDTLYPPYRDSIETAFGIRVLDYYGAGGEGVHLASQCPESLDRYHLHPENAVVEILGPDGPVQPGERGRIVITQLHNQAMPLIRYDLEDIAIKANPELTCQCGRTLPMLERIEGRTPDLVLLPDGTFLVMHFFVVLFKNLQEISNYQIVQEREDHLVVRLVGKPGAERSSVEATITREVSKATRALLSCRFEWLPQIPLAASGKRRLVISEVSREALGLGESD